MIEIRPMGEDYILQRCLHAGPIDAAAGSPSPPARIGLPPHPWSDETICHGAAEGPDFGLCGAGEEFPTEFMREMIQRCETCALLAWREREVVGFVRFYPMAIARLVAKNTPAERRPEPILDPLLACEREEDEGALWVHCVMTSRPYTGATAEAGATSGEDDTLRTPEEAGARRGVGLKLANALVPWAREHGWRRIIKIAPCDLDFFYGQWGGGGKAFWEKAGFRAIGTIHRPQKWSEEDLAILRSQASRKGMTEDDAWTFYRMSYEL